MEVLFNSSTGASTRVALKSGERLLMAGLRSGVDLPYECATGTCGSCLATVEYGSVDNLWPQAPGVKATHGNQNRVLLCQCSARSDCVVSFTPPPTLSERHTSVPEYSSAELIDVARLSHGLYEISVRCTTPYSPAPGQFMLVGAEGISGFRAYSVSAVEEGGLLLKFVVRVGLASGLSKILCDLKSCGDELRLFGPMGTACLYPHDADDVSVVVGGSGLGVAMALANGFINSASLSSRLLKIYIGLRTADCDPVISRLRQIHSYAPNRISSVITFSESATLLPSLPGVEFRSGLVHETVLASLNTWSADPTVFVAGPPPMVDLTVRGLLKSRRCKPTNIRFDRFS
ncbi:MAG: 2Fe-2S iron-sulfur cluster binding domain-containing protein [Burkholderiaceae bacterium]|nr:2Fe-2S iron-sulfur cluster binding domain-containing protein [Burkholderiaceae bacterium]